MAIYTRTGDAGSTSLFTGQRVSKTHPRVEAYGTLDELNAMLSLCVCAVAEEEQRTLLEALQQHIFWFSAELASDSEQPSPGKRYISSEEIALLEQTIDREMARVPALHQFVLPGRCEAASRLHLARTVARRAERRLVELGAEVTIRQMLLRYLNRLSDCLYALARSEDHAAHQRRLVTEIAARYLAASGSPAPDAPKAQAGSLSFHELHQLIRQAIEHARQHADTVVDNGFRWVGAGRHGANNPERRVLKQHHPAIAGEGAGSEILYARRVFKSGFIFQIFIFFVAHAGFRGALFRQRRQLGGQRLPQGADNGAAGF